MVLDLILDTSRKGVALGIYDGETPLCEAFDFECRGESLGTIFDRSLQSAGASAADIARVLVTLGPGSFTGLRTGIAFAEGLCFSGRRALHGVSTLRALRALSPDENAVSVLFARKGFLYVGTATEELFLSAEDACRMFEESGVKAFVVEPRVLEEPASAPFFANGAFDVTLSEGRELLPFRRFFFEVEPCPVLRANYIQPSYYERGGAR